jgi:two-component system nitrate/nitrite response regulator NarL
MIKLFLVDDHQVIIDSLTIMLTTVMDCEIIGSANSGVEAIKALKDTNCDIVIMDLSMPGDLNGIEATEQIKKSRPTIKVLVLTMLSGIHTIAQAMQKGADGYIIKNASAMELKEAIYCVLSDNQYLHPEIKDYFFEAFLRGNLPLNAVISPIEKKVIYSIIKGETTKEIASNIFRSEETIKSHRKNLLKKFNCKNMPELIAFLIKHGFIKV